MFINFFVEKKFFSNTSKNMTEHLHSIKNSIKWKHELHYDPELSKCIFLWSRNQHLLDNYLNRDGIHYTSNTPSVKLTLSR